MRKPEHLKTGTTKIKSIVIELEDGTKVKVKGKGYVLKYLSTTITDKVSSVGFTAHIALTGKKHTA